MKDFSEKLKTLPTASGVYIMLDEFEQILYVGKAKNLKNRVRQYFQNSATKTEKTMLLVEKIADFRYIITNTEVEALVLENNLIKEHQPYYNILLKDDKSYPYIKINLKEVYPKIEVTRKLKADGSKYFGPYMLGLSAKTIMDLIHSAYPVRSCTTDLSKRRKGVRECLNYHINRCCAPCVGKISSEEYKKMIGSVIDFLNGNDKEVKANLEQKMRNASEHEEFELAMGYRDSLRVLDKLVRKQVVNLPKDINMDIFTIADNGMYGVINYMVVRGGKVLGAQNYPVDEAGSVSENLSSYIMQYYEKNPVLADEVLVSETLAFQAELSDYLSSLKGKRVHVIRPRAGVRGQLVDMSFNNAKEHLEVTVTKIASKEALTIGSVSKLQEALSLPRPPKRIECYDISNISGTDKVSSMVVFINGEPSRDKYRRFRIKTVRGTDDFASMRETLTRRLTEMSSDDPSFSERPDLIMVDGGKGQLSSVYDLVSAYNIPVIGLAKREEEIIVPLQKDSVILPRDSLALSLLQRVRDEAHRFAITYHRLLRKERQTRSNLKNIEGIGEKRARALLIYFKKIENIANADILEIMKVNGFGKKQAEIVKKYFEDLEKNEI
ncbi:MAG: excinuclease ABC subunit UvrC [Clostridia bacterium]|nr:excinuclease ABC subunit UvrC [Clostridia bacterium]